MSDKADKTAPHRVNDEYRFLLCRSAIEIGIYGGQAVVDELVQDNCRPRSCLKVEGRKSRKYTVSEQGLPQEHANKSDPGRSFQ